MVDEAGLSSFSSLVLLKLSALLVDDVLLLFFEFVTLAVETVPEEDPPNFSTITGCGWLFSSDLSAVILGSYVMVVT